MPIARYKVDAVARGLEILTLFTVERSSMNLTEIATATKLNKSTAFRMVSTLELLGYLERDPETRQYHPGLKVLQLGFTALNSLEVAQIGQLYLKALSNECGETTNMAIRDGKEIVYVARNATWHIIGVNVQRGSRAPIYCTSMGKAQLIDLSPQELHDLLGEGPYPKMGPNTIEYLKDLLVELEKIRQQGYAVNDQELATGLRSVAAPIRDAQGKIVAAINISMPGFRISREELEEHLAPMVKETARLISSSLGATL
ncbi:MAG TPA: IclR family transcriptional regulator [Anaerolineales bacterium]|nr:IclR family transcriptional regulator [Anaerolineales bacterium]